MSDETLESLDNASLRKKCLEYGLPNVPITDTSRKVIIRKLRATMAGEPMDKKKNRRETIHATKIPSLVETASSAEEEPKRPPSRINRRTIAATSVTSTVDDMSLPAVGKPSAVISGRRSVVSQSSQDAAAPIKMTQNLKTAAVFDENDDEFDDVLIVEPGDRNRELANSRRSVSLSKTGVVTTSYSQEKVVNPTTVSSEPLSARQLPTLKHSVLSQSKENAPAPTPYTQSFKTADVFNENDDEYYSRNRELTNSRRSVSLSKTGVVTTSYNQEKVVTPATVSSETVNIHQLPPQVYDAIYELPQQKATIPDSISSYRTITANRIAIEPEAPFVPKIPPRYSSRDFGYSTGSAASSVTTSTNRRFTTGGYGSSIDPPTTKYTSTYDEDKDSDDQSEAPYLSDFARKLERLKVEPLMKGLASPRSVPLKRESQRYQTSIVGRRSTAQASVTDSFMNFIAALDRKYKLKRNFSIVLAVIVILFVYIVFVH